MNHKTVGYVFVIILVVIVLAACNAAGPEGEQPPTPEENTDTSEAVFDLKPDGCDFVCLASSWLSDNAHPIDDLASAE